MFRTSPEVIGNAVLTLSQRKLVNDSCFPPTLKIRFLLKSAVHITFFKVKHCDITWSKFKTRYSSVSKMLSLQVCRPEFWPQNPHRRARGGGEQL